MMKWKETKCKSISNNPGLLIYLLHLQVSQLELRIIIFSNNLANPKSTSQEVLLSFYVTAPKKIYTLGILLIIMCSMKPYTARNL